VCLSHVGNECGPLCLHLLVHPMLSSSTRHMPTVVFAKKPSHCPCIYGFFATHALCVPTKVRILSPTRNAFLPRNVQGRWPSVPPRTLAAEWPLGSIPRAPNIRLRCPLIGRICRKFIRFVVRNTIASPVLAAYISPLRYIITMMVDRETFSPPPTVIHLHCVPLLHDR
jgi:hypothetical protein